MGAMPVGILNYNEFCKLFRPRAIYNRKYSFTRW